MPVSEDAAEQQQPVRPVPATEDVLPNVTPPGAGFILQLFLIPLIIVTIIVSLYLMFSWFAHMGGSPAKLAAEIDRGGNATWQKAATLADLLRNPQYDHLKKDKELAQSLAKSLEARLDKTDEEQISLCVFLSRALGEFYIDDGLPALCLAAGPDTAPDVRRTAVEAIAVLAPSLGREKMQNNRQVMAVLKKAATANTAGEDPQDELGVLRQTAAFALGVVGGDEAIAALNVLLADAYPNARYNAATGLARNGDIRAEDGLLEMLDPNNEQVVADESNEYGVKFKRGLVLINAIRSVELLARANPGADVSELKAAIKRLLEADINTNIKLNAREVLDRLKSIEAANAVL